MLVIAMEFLKSWMEDSENRELLSTM